MPVRIPYDNAEFDAVGGLPVPHVRWLVEQRRLFETQADFTAAEACRHLSDHRGAGRYGGYVVTRRPSDFVQARRIAAARPFGETVKYVVSRFARTDDGRDRIHGFSPPWPLDRVHEN